MRVPIDPRFAASCPVPKNGIADIAHYVPGKAGAAGIKNPLKLSANENILGCSPKAREAYVAAVGRLNLYPDGRAAVLRAAVSQRYGLEAHNRAIIEALARFMAR